MKKPLLIIAISFWGSLSIAQSPVVDTTLNAGYIDTVASTTNDSAACQWVKATIGEYNEPTVEAKSPDYRSEDYAFDGWYNKRSSIVSYLTIIASIVTIIGIISIFGSMRRNVISRSCQRRIIIDLIRHFFVNMAIVEAVIHQLKNKKIKPAEGVFARLATLDTDMNLDRFVPNAENYETIHNLSLSMRNYNLYVNMVEEHIRVASKPSIDGLINEVYEVRSRLKDLVAKLWVLQVISGHRISVEEATAYIEKNYRNDVISIDDKLAASCEWPFKIDSKYWDKIEAYEKRREIRSIYHLCYHIGYSAKSVVLYLERLFLNIAKWEWNEWNALETFRKIHKPNYQINVKEQSFLNFYNRYIYHKMKSLYK